MKPVQFRRSFSSFLFSLTITLLFCGLAAGLLYVDWQCHQTVSSAGGLLLPLEQKLLTLVRQVFHI
ncbi:MAG: hypothetical protein IIU00_00185 [Clostridia bacterium]|nr:hypothetical protein [Clostridia bacterium]